jgi:hypothetical protein
MASGLSICSDRPTPTSNPAKVTAMLFRAVFSAGPRKGEPCTSVVPSKDPAGVAALCKGLNVRFASMDNPARVKVERFTPEADAPWGILGWRVGPNGSGARVTGAGHGECFGSRELWETYQTDIRKVCETYAPPGPAFYSVPLATESAWKWREREMLKQPSGTFWLPWRGAPWWLESHKLAMHYPRPAETPGNIAYTPSEGYGERDRQVSTSVRRYLEREFPDVPADERETYARKWDKEHSPLTLRFATTRKEIRHVYENGPRSCMGGPASGFDCGPTHPAEVYAAGDLAVAYLEGRDGEIKARGLCWPDRELFFTPFYGATDKLSALLEAKGWEDGEPEGAKLLELRDDMGRLVMPYLDNGMGYSFSGSGLVIDCEGQPADSTNGIAPDENRHPCATCGTRIDPDYDDSGPDPGTGDLLCWDCYGERVSFCDGCCEDVYRDDTVETEDGPRCDGCAEDYRECPGPIGEERQGCQHNYYPVYIPDMIEGPDGEGRCLDCHEDSVEVCDECADEVERGTTETDERGYQICPECAQHTLELEETAA